MANILYRSFLGLLFGIQYWLYAEGQGRIIDKHALIGQQVNLTCHLNSTENVTWHYNAYDDKFPAVYTCQYNQNGECTHTEAGLRLQVYTRFEFQATRSYDTSQFSLKLSEEEHAIKCRLGNVFMRTFRVKTIDPNKLESNCSVTSPSRNENGVGSMTLSCEVNSGELDVNLTLKGIGINVLPDVTTSSQSVKAKTLNFDDFNNIHNASCNAYFSDINEIRSCTYPNIKKAQYIDEGNGIIVECDDEPYVDNWRLYGSDGREEDIKNRSWSRKGGRILLIKEISEKDVGKVVMCRTKGYNNQTNNGNIGLHVISKISGDINNSNSEGPAPPPSAHNPYLVLMLLFLSLWLITTAVGGVWLGCTPKRNKPGNSAIALASENASAPNGGSGECETSLFNVATGARGDPNALNTNNSAHNPAFEHEVNIADENNRNRQSNNDSHLYFTLEKSSPSPMNSLPRASIARWEQPDANPASLNHPQNSHWQGYEMVGEPKKGATCSYDLGEYAEVGKHFQGNSPPDLGEYAEVGKHSQGKWPPDLSGRPSIPKKPGREKVKGDDISRLYSKVNK